ncbi:MAG: H4MPT-linked C1 transfer pathway protein [Methanomicrobiales archaeon]|nr:H4MPT-linked C1 transfer pathway protein [Methanomicrobiales archaeon]
MIGIDIGGANLKVVDEKGVHIHYCPLWRDSPLPHLLAQYAGEPAAVVMSGELADCFSSKAEGIAFIVNTVKDVCPDACFYGTDGRFHEGAVPGLAAANWLVAADYLRSAFPRSVLVDMGSTTTDIIPLSPFSRLLGMTDLARLQQGYLVYTGLLRTNLVALLRSVTLREIPTPVASEYFAQTADVHRVIGTIGDREYSVPTPDGADTSREASLRRLARVVCADLEEIGDEGAVAVAEQAWEIQSRTIRDAVGAMVQESGNEMILAAGVGSGCIARLCGARDLTKELGPVSDALPAYAVREVLLRSGGC